MPRVSAAETSAVSIARLEANTASMMEAVGRGEIPLSRAYRPSGEERMIRELVLQLKSGSVRPQYFRDKYRSTS